MDRLYSLGFHLNRTAFSLAKALRTEFKNNNIDLPHFQYVILKCVFHKSDLSQQELATLLHKDAAAIKRSLDNLEEKGLITRTQVSQRENAIILTDRGRDMAPMVIEQANFMLDRILENVDEVEMSLLYKLLDEIYTKTENLE